MRVRGRVGHEFPELVPAVQISTHCANLRRHITPLSRLDGFEWEQRATVWACP